MIRLALVGCGAVADKHAAAIAADSDAELLWLCDPRREAAERLAQFHAPYARIAASWEALPLDEIDAVVIASPTSQHAEQVAAALRSGKHVLCEKPLATGSEPIRQLITLRDAHQRVLSVAFQRRTESPYVAARKLISERRRDWGKLKTIHLFVCEKWAQTIVGTWRDDPALGFGYFGDAGVHQVDSIAFMTGYAPHRVHARGDCRGRRVEVVTDVRSEWCSPDGDEAVMTAQFVGDAHHWREDIALHFENADLLLRSCEVWLCQENQCRELTGLAPNSSPVADFLATCRGKQTTAAPAECGLLSALWTEAVLESLRTRDWSDIDSRKS